MKLKGLGHFGDWSWPLGLVVVELQLQLATLQAGHCGTATGAWAWLPGRMAIGMAEGRLAAGQQAAASRLAA
ncbi:hypothetical protein TIFTF001_018771 [Ficus carica]|uniref:Uncharacterized protein n=1 Tax=Ficus carica TaxID=3494 RepID=A0AA88AC25_FICCA|nr:hypothetical protein TIFTF001_018771 [Ficus carica]